jgi:hypothetical protein
MTENRWAELRQVGFAALDHAAAVRAATDLLELGPGFGDPLLAELNLADFTAPIGPDTYIEVLSPTVSEHSVARWLRRVGGAAGWVLSTQVPSLDGVTERAAEHGVRIAVQTQALGRNIVQFHPLDIGVLLELDEFLPRDAWFWDDLETARAAQASRSAKVDDIVAVDVAAEGSRGHGRDLGRDHRPRAPGRNGGPCRDRLWQEDHPLRARRGRPRRDRRRRPARHGPGARPRPHGRTVPHAHPLRLSGASERARLRAGPARRPRDEPAGPPDVVGVRDALGPRHVLLQ